MVRQTHSSESDALASFDPFSGPEVEGAEELELIDLMSFTGIPDAVRPESLEALERELDLHLGITLPRWDHLEPKGLYARFLKPIASISTMLVALPIALLVMLPIAIINWVATGDRRLIFFTQERVGQYGRIFKIYKFRTMRPVDGGDFAAWSSGDANRVTRFGKFLRSTHLDEVPQILNILRGEMDFIGPRPEMVAIHNWACREVPGFERRLTLRPGITGLAQITQGYTGQCPEAYAEKLAGDDCYRENLSFRLEIWIVARTALWMLCGRGWKWDASKAGC
jgi:lipopolysaccharide/colanic/teichoic acid biosynthesis glycosyltransferase